MRTEVSPAVVVTVIVVLLAVIVFAYWRATKPKEVVNPRVTAPTMPIHE